MRLFFLGDIHGNFNLLTDYIKLYDLKDAHIIQVGDFGLGFSPFEKEKRMLEMYHHILVKNNVTVWAIRGNHDYKPYFDNDPFGLTNIKLVKDYTVLNLANTNILCIGGAISVDRKIRMNKNQHKGTHTYLDNKVNGETWWPSEVFNLDVDMLGTFRNIDTVVTHCAPAYCPPDNTFGFGPLIDSVVLNYNDLELKTDLMVERQKLNDAFIILKMNNDIKNHYYGHFHKSDKMNYQGTIHRLLGIGELWEQTNNLPFS